MKDSPLIWDLNDRQPNVLFLGNGINYNDKFSWNNVINKTAENEENTSLLKHSGSFQVPNTILSFALCSDDDTKRHSTYLDAFKEYDHEPNEQLNKLLDIPFNAILTTNYTYELEQQYKSDYSQLSASGKRKYAFQYAKDSKYLIHTFNKFSDSPPIWHVHGELRRKSSMILSHDEYARLIGEIVSHNKQLGNGIEKYYSSFKAKSWVDYFVVGNIFFRGYSLDFSELDIWWLLGRKLRERAPVGNVFFYEPASEQNRYKHEVLKMKGFNVETLGYKTNDDYKPFNEFYYAAINDIRSKIEE